MAALPPPSRASAPGKLILFGEHAVVYGHDALAVALSDLRVPAQVQLTPERALTLSFPDTEPAAAAAAEPGSSSSSSARLTFSWPLAELRASALRASLAEAAAAAAAAAAPSAEAAPQASGGARALPRALPPTPAVQAALAELVRALPSAAHRRACTPLLFLACAILAPRLLGEEEDEEEEAAAAAAAGGAGAGGAALTVLPPSLPIGAGLGSSAAVSAACAAALLHARARLPAPLDAAALAAVNAWAYSAETLFHGAPSGLDNTVATFGGALLYARGGGGGGGAAFRQLRLASQPLRLLLVNTRVPKDTAALVAGVGALRAALPAVVAPLLQCIGAVVAEARAALEGSGSSSSSAGAGAGAGAGAAPEDLHAALSRLARINHSALNALGVGHAALDAVVAAAAQRGLAAKLTGAGGGG